MKFSLSPGKTLGVQSRCTFERVTLMVQGVMFVVYLFMVASIQISLYCGLMVSVNIAFQLAGILLILFLCFQQERNWFSQAGKTI